MQGGGTESGVAIRGNRVGDGECSDSRCPPSQIRFPFRECSKSARTGLDGAQETENEDQWVRQGIPALAAVAVLPEEDFVLPRRLHQELEEKRALADEPR